MTDPYDLVGVGFGPSNLSLAIAAAELDPERECLFFERSDRVRWHPGMLIDGARMQISYLKDLVSLRNLASPYTFLAYLKAHGRLERFVNLDESHPTRLEYQDYLTWVSRHFQDVVEYNTEVVRISPVAGPESEVLDLLRVEVRDPRTGRARHCHTRNVVYAPGGKPRWCGDAVSASAAVVHSSRFLPDFVDRFPDHDVPREFGVVGDGQSAAEIAGYLLRGYPTSRVHLFVRGYALRATDNSSFVNESFYGCSAKALYATEPARRAALLEELRGTNYGVVEGGFLEDLYRQAYADDVRGRQRLIVHRAADVARVEEAGAEVAVRVRDRHGGPPRTVRCDGVVMATGYTRTLDDEICADLLPLLERDESGKPVVSQECRVRTDANCTAGLYVQGFAESSFGIGDSLLSLLPFRSEQILTDIRGNVARKPAPVAKAAYPPGHYVERDRENIYAVMSRFNFATLISSDADGDVHVTHVPFVLDRAHGEHGRLLGHLDRANPQVPLLESGQATVVFHGPNAYLSPLRLRKDALPTWNSMSVHVRGRARLFSGRTELLRVFNGLCEHADPGQGAYRLRPDDTRVDRLLDHVVGFEIEIDELVGRFKLSQELDDADRALAAADLLRANRIDECALIEQVFGLSVQTGPSSKDLAEYRMMAS